MVGCEAWYQAGGIHLGPEKVLGFGPSTDDGWIFVNAFLAALEYKRLLSAQWGIQGIASLGTELQTYSRAWRLQDAQGRAEARTSPKGHRIQWFSPPARPHLGLSILFLWQEIPAGKRAGAG